MGLRRRPVSEIQFFGSLVAKSLRFVLGWKDLWYKYEEAAESSHFLTNRWVCSIFHKTPSSICLLEGSENVLLLVFPKGTLTHSHTYLSQHFLSSGFQSFSSREEIFPYLYHGCNITSPLGMEPWQVFQEAACPEGRRWDHFSGVGSGLSWELSDMLICRYEAKAAFCELFNTGFSRISTSFTI